MNFISSVITLIIHCYYFCFKQSFIYQRYLNNEKHLYLTMHLPFPCSSFTQIKISMWYSIYCCCSQYLKILLHFLVVYVVSNRRFANICIFVPLAVTYPFSLLPMSLLLVLSNLIMMNFDIVLFITWDFLCISWMLLYSFHEFLKIFSYYFFKCVLFPASSGTLCHT